MDIPTESDWSHSPDNLDAASAYKHFHGKTIDEAFALFVDNSMRYQEDSMFMPMACFYFYVNAYIDYLHSDRSEGDSDGASCFFGIVDVRLDDIRNGPRAVRDRICRLLRRIGESQAWYQAEVEVYGRFADKASGCLKMIEDSSSVPEATDEWPKDLPVGMSQQHGTVVRVFTATHDGAHFRAYHVKWLDQDVIVSDFLAASDLKPGDNITFMAMSLSIPATDAGRKILQLHFTDFGPLMQNT